MAQTNLTILDYFNWKAYKVPPCHVQLQDVKTSVPLPLLSYTINKLFPAYILGYRDSSFQTIRDEFTTVEKESLTEVLTGSSAEGLQVFYYATKQTIDITVSDADVMIIPKREFLSDISVYEEGIVPVHLTSTSTRLSAASLKKQFQKAYPGYVVLTPKEKFQPMVKHLKDIPDFDSYIKSSYTGQGYISKDTGPSLEVSVNHFDAYGNTVVNKTDFVYAYPCNGWPIQAKTWPNRYRPGKWPSSDQIKGILEKETHFVKKAPPVVSTEESLYYWRISFSIAEKELCLSFNDTQRHCAILMKLLKQKELFAKDQITSYHIKTIIFWACEEIPEAKWKTELVGNCFLHLLDKLYLAVVKRHLPHYFIPELNLFENIPRETLMTMASVILKLRNNPLQFIGSFSESYVTFYMQQRKKILGVTDVTANFFKHQIQLDLLQSSSDLLKLFTIMLVIAKKNYEQYGRNHIFNDYIKCLEKMADIVGSAIKHRKTCLDLVNLAILAVFDEVSITPYFDYIKEQKLPSNATVLGQDKTLRDKTLFFEHLQLAHKADSDIIAGAKGILPTFKTIFT